MKIFLMILAFMSSVLVNAQTTNDVWINEFHYDGLTSYGQSDQNEFVELVIKTSIATNPTELAKYSLVLYSSGALDNVLLTPGKGLPYNTASPLYLAAETVYPLSAFQSCPSGTTEFTMLSQSMAILQDLPAAMAIVYNNVTVVQLLSYEKSFKIAPAPGGGAAANLSTTLMITGLGDLADETALSPTNHSVALMGTGNNYSQFVWDDNVIRTATPCAVNGGQTLTGGVLPVTLMFFNVIKKDAHANLYWEISSPLNLKSFEIERSGDGISFTKIGLADAIGGQLSYNFSDNATLKGKNFYRLKMIDTDERFKYSQSKLLNFDRKNIFVISPNPAQSKVTLQFDEVMKDATVRITDKQGRVVKQFRMNAADRTDVYVSDLAAGIYVIEVTSGTHRSLEKLVISR